ncbi:Spherulation-specific family 4-domain-containing protein [Aspergillus tetrazonus]
MRLGYRLCLCGLLAGSAVLAQDIDYGAAAESISAVLADPTFVPYAKPTQKVSKWIAVGDSYTAGTGCNGNDERMGGDAVRGQRSYPMQMAQDAANWGFINSDDTLPRFSFHAILNDCVYRVALPGDCQETLNDLQRELDSGSFQDKVNYRLFQVAHAEREAGGTSPRESFQVFVLEYVTFFGTGAECNDYSWSYFGWSTPKLSLALRQQLNDMVLKVNAAIKAAAEDLRRMGVIYVEGIQDAYNGHRYREPGASHVMTEYNGAGDPNNAASTEVIDPGQQLLDFMFPGEGKLVSDASESNPPWEWAGAEEYADFEALLDAIQAAAGEEDGAGIQWPVPFNLLRSFHPKATAYGVHAEALFAAIADNRDAVATGGDGGQQIAIASVLVANVLNGPDYVVDDSWKSVIDQAASQGKKILGYVRTGYLGVSQQQFTTRLGSRDLADWASQIEQDIDKWYELYGSSLGGIFFDEGWRECGDNNIYADLYAYIDDYTKRKHPGAYTVLNLGSPIAQCYEETMDTLLTFENTYETYQNLFVPNDWTPQDPRKIWHIIYNVPQDQIASVAALASDRNIGLIEITDDVAPNPYNNLPSDAYMQAVIGAVSGGTPLIKGPADVTSFYVAGLPGDVTVAASEYSSVTLDWSSVANALGYAVYMNGNQVLELPPSLTRATIDMLDPGTSGITFEVRTVLSSGSGGTSRTISDSTKSLPEDGTIANVGFTESGDTVTYTADVLVPYAFVRLFVGKDQPDPGIGSGWPIQSPELTDQGVAEYQIVNYMVEGNDFYSGLYEYTGAWYETTTANADWMWATIAEAKQTQDGYTYTWSVPLGSTEAVAKEYVIQGQGYAPINNVFKGTLRHYGTV